MAFVRPLIDYNGNLQEVAVNDYIQPAILGAGTPSSNTILDGSGNWVTVASLNYWTLTGSDVYRATGNVYIGNASSYGPYKLQVTGDSYFNGTGTFMGTVFANSVGNNIRLMANGTSSLDGFIGSDANGIIYLSNWDATRGWRINSNGNINSLGNGNVGIGTTNPLAKLMVAGDIMAGATNKIGFNYNVSDGNFYNFIEWHQGSGALNIVGGTWTGSTTQEAIRLSTLQGVKMSILNDGNIGIYNTTPINKLDIRGNSHSSLGGRNIFGDDGNFTPTFKQYRWTGEASNYFASSIETQGDGFGVPALFLRVASGATTIGAESFVNVMTLVGNGKVLIGTTSVYNGSLVQVNGSITQRGVLGKMIYADGTGQLIEATASHIAATLGAGNYIQNQFSAAQSGSFWINGKGFIQTSGATPSLALYRTDAVDSTFRMSTNFVGGSYVDLNPFITGVSNGGFEIKINGAQRFVINPTSGHVGIGETNPLEKLHVNGRGYFSGANTSISFARPDTVRVGGIGWNVDNYFYVGGHPEYGAMAGSDVRVYGFGGRLFLGTQALGDVVTLDSSGKVIIGGTSSVGSSILQIQGSIYSSTLTGSSVLLKTVSGVITRVEPSDMVNLIGDYYIRNQYSSPQGANSWISGIQRADLYTKSGRYGYYGTYDHTQVQGIWSISENYPIDIVNNTFGYQYGLVYAYEHGTTNVARRPLAGYSHQVLFVGDGLVNAAISINTGKAYFKGNVGIGVTDTHSRLHINGYNPRIWIQDPDATNTPYFYQELIANGTTPYMQMQVGDYAAYRNLILQPLGGKVVIGGSSDYGTYKLQVLGESLIHNGMLHIESTSPTIRLRDTDNRGAYIHVNSDIFYILRMDNSGTGWYPNSSGKWPLYINLENNEAVFGGSIHQEYTKSSLVYADNGGKLIGASAQNVRDLLGTGSYIQNQFASTQVDSAFWVGAGRVGSVTTTGGLPTFSVTGSHSTAHMSVYSVGNGTLTASLDLWASEPGLTFDGSGIGNNINTSPYYGRRNSALASSYIRFYGGHIFFSSSTTERTNPANSPMILSNTERLLIGYGGDVNTYKVQINSGSATGAGLYVNGNINASGSIIADGYFSGTSSDRLYKSEFKEVSVYNVIDNIDVSSYKHKLYDNKRLIGSVAQDIQKYFPELITEDNNGRLRVDNYGYAALALQLGKETKSEVEKLKERIKELEIRLGI